jgi:hypothetical protein
MLNVKMPLLDVRPYLLVRYRNYALRELSPYRPSHSRIPRGDYVSVDVKGATDVSLSWVLHERWGAFQRGCNCFVAVRMLEKYAVTTPNRGLTIAPRIPRKPDAWCWIE